MNLFGIDFTHQSSTGFSLSGAAARSANAAAQTPEPTASAAVSLSSKNMMASHFVHSGREQSEYVNGLMIGLDVQNKFASQMQSVVAGYRNVVALTSEVKASQGKEITNADLYLLGMQAAESVGDVVDGEVTESNAEQAEEIRQDVEERAEKATASESEKVLEDETSPIEELEESLDEAEPEAGNDQSASPLETASGVEPAADTKPSAYSGPVAASVPAAESKDAPDAAQDLSTSIAADPATTSARSIDIYI